MPNCWICENWKLNGTSGWYCAFDEDQEDCKHYEAMKANEFAFDTVKPPYVPTDFSEALSWRIMYLTIELGASLEDLVALSQSLKLGEFEEAKKILQKYYIRSVYAEDPAVEIVTA